MKLLYKVVLFFFILYSVMMVWIIFTYEPVTQQLLRYCESDQDCVQVRASCCSCSEGGEDTCINSNYQEMWENSMSKDCRNVACIQVYNCPDASCQCINNTCVFHVQG